jgi:uncharacterized iron-regulated protein
VNTDVTSYAIIAAARERRVPMGWHAIEAMLWTPGRLPTDFAAQEPTSREARRGRLTAKLARILIEDLELVANQWDAARTNSFAQKLVGGSLDAGFKSALGGVSSFAKKEVVERKLGTVLAGAAEVSDASDSTRADVAANLLGIEGLLHAREGRVTAPSFVDLVRRDDPALADTLVKRVVDARAAVDRCPELGDVAKDPSKRASAEAARDAQVAVAAALDDVLRHYSLTPLTP